jgi:hypothetical protein
LKRKLINELSNEGLKAIVAHLEKSYNKNIID